MPLDKTRLRVNRAIKTPLHDQVAEVFRVAIDSGELGPNEKLPREEDLAADFGVNRTTIRRGMDLLVAEGLVEKRAGVPTRVKVPPPVRAVSAERYSGELALLRAKDEHPQTSAFTADYGASWSDYTIDASYTEGVVGPDEVEPLDVPEGTPVLRRLMVKRLQGAPKQVQVSTMPLAKVQGTPVADPARQPWPGGTIAELWSIGCQVDAVREDVMDRLPTPDERVMLELPTGSVFQIDRVFYSAGRPVEVSVCVFPSGGTKLRFMTQL